MKANQPERPVKFRSSTDLPNRSSPLTALERARLARTGRATIPGPPNHGNTIIQRIDGIDWRYKAQITIGLCVVIIAATYIFRDRIFNFGEWGYLGAFLINGISSATIIFPAPGGIVIAVMAQDFNPLLIGIAAGLGGTLGGSTAYFAGLLNSGSIQRSKWLHWFESLMRKAGGPVVFIFALIPILPGDFASIMAGGVRYPLHKYLLFNGLGSMIKMSVVAYFGSGYLQRLEDMLIEWWHGLF